MIAANANIGPEPNLLDLARALRNLPSSFQWDYSDQSTCAIALTRKLWNVSEDVPMAEVYHLPYNVVNDIFFDVRPPSTFRTWFGLDRRRQQDVKPKHVANAIDNFLAKRYREGY